MKTIGPLMPRQRPTSIEELRREPSEAFIVAQTLLADYGDKAFAEFAIVMRLKEWRACGYCQRAVPTALDRFTANDGKTRETRFCFRCGGNDQLVDLKYVRYAEGGGMTTRTPEQAKSTALTTTEPRGD